MQRFPKSFAPELSKRPGVGFQVPKVAHLEMRPQTLLYLHPREPQTKTRNSPHPLLLGPLTQWRGGEGWRVGGLTPPELQNLICKLSRCWKVLAVCAFLPLWSVWLKAPLTRVTRQWRQVLGMATAQDGRSFEGPSFAKTEPLAFP